MDDETRQRPRNTRRGSKSTMIFRICIGVAILGLWIGLALVSSSVRALRESMEGLGSKGGTSPIVAAQPDPVDQGSADEVKRLSLALEKVQGELRRSSTKSAESLATSERAAAAERLKLTGDLARILVGLGAKEEDLGSIMKVLPVEDQQRLLKDLQSVAEGSPVAPVEPPAPPAVIVPEPEVTPEPEEEETGAGEPEGDDYLEYSIKRGDTLSHIARRYKVSVEEILTLNNITDSRKIQIGQVLKIPRRAE